MKEYSAPSRILSLSGTWKLSADGVKEIPSKVPGDVLDDLRSAGLIKDPCYRMDYLDCVWCGEKEWVCRKIFRGSFPADEMHDLVFDGLSYVAEIELNGKHLATHKTMMRGLRIPVAGILRDNAENELVVRLKAFNKEELNTPVISFWSDWSEGVYDSRFAAMRGAGRKAHYSYGWDWTHGLPSCGIWRDVRVESFAVARPEKIFAETSPDGRIRLSFQLHTELEDILDCRAALEIREKETGKPVFSAAYPVKLGPGETEYVFDAQVDSPELWYPAGYGKQALYELRLQIFSGMREVASFRHRFAFRLFEIEEKRFTEKQGLFQFRVNGIPVFANGGNWVPPDMLPGTVGRERLRHLIALAAECGYNYLRVWGGGYYESDDFYDLCDEAGIMVWQDFMFGGPEVPEFDPAFRAECRREAEEVVCRLRRHPCICVWCGSNETDEFYLVDRNCKRERPGGYYYGWTLLHRDFPEIVRRLVPDAVYIPSCPFMGTAAPAGTENNAHGFGTCHTQWLPQFSPDEAFDRTVIPTFMNEFYGMCPVPASSVKRFLLPEDLDCYCNPVFSAHNMLEVQRNDEWGQIFRHLCFHDPRRRFDVPLAELLRGFEICAEELMTRYLALLRRNRKYCGGAGYWQFNSAYPMINCDIVDYYGLPKASYYAVKRAAVRTAPVLAVYDDRFDVYMVNNSAVSATGALHAALKDFYGNTLAEERKTVSLEPECSKKIFSVPRGSAVPCGSFAWAEWRGENGSSAETHRFFRDPRELRFPEAEVAIRRLTENEVVLRSNRFARRVSVTPYDTACYPSDNFFDLYPGAEKRIVFSSPLRETIRVEYENCAGRSPYVTGMRKTQNPEDDFWEIELYNPGREGRSVSVSVECENCDFECASELFIPAEETALFSIRLRSALFREYPFSVPVTLHFGETVLLETFSRISLEPVLHHGVLNLRNAWEKPLPLPRLEYRAKYADGTDFVSVMPGTVLRKGERRRFDFDVPESILPDSAVLCGGDSPIAFFESKYSPENWWSCLNARPFDGGDFPLVPAGAPLSGCRIRANEHAQFLSPMPESRAELCLFWEKGEDLIRMTLYVRGIPYSQPYEGERVWRAACIELLIGTADKRNWRDLSLALTEAGPQICLRRSSGKDCRGLVPRDAASLEVLRSGEHDLMTYRLELHPSLLGMPELSSAKEFRFGMALRYPDKNALQIYKGINYGNGLRDAGLATMNRRLEETIH